MIRDFPWPFRNLLKFLLIVEEIQPNTPLLEATYIFKVDAELRLQLPKTSQFQQRHPAQPSRTHWQVSGYPQLLYNPSKSPFCNYPHNHNLLKSKKSSLRSYNINWILFHDFCSYCSQRQCHVRPNNYLHPGLDSGHPDPSRVHLHVSNSQHPREMLPVLCCHRGKRKKSWLRRILWSRCHGGRFWNHFYHQ